MERLAQRLASQIRHLVILRGGMGKKELNAAAARLAAIPPHDERVLLATGRYLGEGFDDSALNFQLFLN